MFHIPKNSKSKIVIRTQVIYVLLLHSHIHVHAGYNTDAMNNRRRKTSLTKYLPLALLQGCEKGYSRFACERVLETEQKLQYFDLHSYGHQRCVFLVLLMLNRRPWGPLCWVLAFFTASYQHLLWTPTHQGPKAPSAWCGFPNSISSYYDWNSTQLPVELNCPLTSVLIELYNSSMPTRSPTRSLKSHVWSTSSGNNCHAVQRSLTSGASVYKSIMGFFSLSHFVSQFPPTRFPLITAIRMCHFLPVHHLGRAFLAGFEGQNITLRPMENSQEYVLST